MRRHPRRANVDSNSPRAWGTDDRSGFVGNHEDMLWQYDWAGTKLIKKNILVFEDQLDKPQRQLGTIILPPDPAPVINARPEPYAIDEAMQQNYVTEDGLIYYAASGDGPTVLYVTETVVSPS